MQRERDTFKGEFERVSAEYAVVVGHNNKKQRIHYLENLKQELNKLVEENTVLRAKLNL